MTARLMYQEARDECEQLSRAHSEDVPAWSRVPRRPMQDGKTWTSVYHRHQTRVPSVRSLLMSWARQKDSRPLLETDGANEVLEAFWASVIEAENLRYERY